MASDDFEDVSNDPTLTEVDTVARWEDLSTRSWFMRTTFKNRTYVAMIVLLNGTYTANLYASGVPIAEDLTDRDIMFLREEVQRRIVVHAMFRTF
jgi:hypothetical protein